MEDIQDAARTQAEELSHGMGDRAANVAQAVRSASDALRGREDWLADAAESLGRSLERLSASAREKGFEGIKQDVEQLARDRPVVFMGSALAIGLALGRVLRSRTPAERLSEGEHDAYAAATEPGREQHAAGAGWPSAPEAAARPVGAKPSDGRSAGNDGNTGDGRTQ